MPIELHQGLVVYLPSRIVALSIVKHFGKASTFRLNRDLDFQIPGDCASRYGIDDYIECSSAHVRMRP